MRWEDESKTLQSFVHLKAEVSSSNSICLTVLALDMHYLCLFASNLSMLQVFSSFSCPVARKFSVQSSQLLDTLNVFSSSTAAVKMSYPGPNGELMLEWVIYFKPALDFEKAFPNSYPCIPPRPLHLPPPSPLPFQLKR